MAEAVGAAVAGVPVGSSFVGPNALTNAALRCASRAADAGRALFNVIKLTT